jgi:sugar phosphate isomerase/epimerase
LSHAAEEIMKLACQEHLIPGASLIEKWECISAAGFDGIELRGLGDFQFRERLPELRAARNAGVVMPSVCVIMDHFIGDFDPARRRDAVENMRSLLSVIAEVGGYGAITPAAYGMFSLRLPPFTPPRSPEDDRKVLIESLHKLGEHAAGEGVYVLFEPLNRYEDHMVHTLAEAVDLCAAVGLPSVRVMADLFHMNIEERDLASAITQAADYLMHVHLADSNRLQPGLGHTDFRSAFRAIHQIGFSGFLALECHLQGEPRAALTETARYLRSVYDEASAL